MDFYSQQFPQLLVQKKSNQLWLTLNNPDQSNAITYEIIDSLGKVLKHADFDPEIRVIVITGAGKNFCSGGDIKAMAEKTGMFQGEGNELRMRYQQGIQQIPKTIEDISTPIIAMVNGAAIGAGCDLAMMCDMRIGTTSTKFGETFTKIGLIPGDGGTFFLQRVVGYAKAMEMTLTGDLYEGQKAKDCGLLNILTDDTQLLAETEKLAAKIAANAPVAQSMAKKAMKISYLHDLQTSLDLLAAFQGITQRTQDHFEALEAAKNKRPPSFKGQ
ncbi:enoyl-CoA hydratase-related protein [Bdellovibrio sp. HCB337]|uniref:enoyl-CoA hydratase-related protein n=1 Tax=Bdellovibrio sp. HCB337 TaxID=3394358 RepID=UPI0039A4CC61